MLSVSLTLSTTTTELLQDVRQICLLLNRRRSSVRSRSGLISALPTLMPASVLLSLLLVRQTLLLQI